MIFVKILVFLKWRTEIRKPIYLNKNAVALITVFTRNDKIEDMWITDYPEYDENHEKVAEEAAKEFMEQLEGWHNELFLRALKKEINKRLKGNRHER